MCSSLCCWLWLAVQWGTRSTGRRFAPEPHAHIRSGNSWRRRSRLNPKRWSGRTASRYTGRTAEPCRIHGRANRRGSARSGFGALESPAVSPKVDHNRTYPRRYRWRSCGVGDADGAPFAGEREAQRFHVFCLSVTADRHRPNKKDPGTDPKFVDGFQGHGS